VYTQNIYYLGFDTKRHLVMPNTPINRPSQDKYGFQKDKRLEKKQNLNTPYCSEGHPA
jgi:hypothetical protein